MKNRLLLFLLRDFLIRHPNLFFGLIFAVLMSGGLSLLVAISVAPLADYLLDPSLTKVNNITLKFISILESLRIAPGILVFSAAFALGNLVNSFFMILIFFINRKIGYAVLRDLNATGFQNFLEARWGFFGSLSQGTILNTFQHEIVKVGDAMTSLANQLAVLFQLVILMSLPIFLMPLMVITSIATLAVLTIPFLLLQRVNNKLGALNTSTANRMMELLHETFQGIKIVQGYGRQQVSMSRYLKAYDDHVQVTLTTQMLTSGVSNLHYVIGIFAALAGMGVAIAYGAVLSEVAITLWSLQRVIPLANSMLVNKVNLDNFVGSYEQLQNIYKNAKDQKERMGDRTFSRFENEIKFVDVDFSYPKRNQLFKKLNIQILKGEMVAFVGESGSGKSTIVDLILGLQVPDSGKIFLDGVAFDEWDKNSYREKIGYVPQDPILFHSSIRDNLLWSREDSTEEELWQACKIANADQFIQRLPNGLDTIVGDRGVLLSGGQRQRIALARAMLRKPPVLILDEATSSLDSESEQLIQQSVDSISSETTIIIIAHRLSTIMKANRIYVLKSGELLETGNFSELIQKPNGYFASMFEMQTGTSVRK
ncbi:ABC transporter ATP-binding protein [Leptospira interrogans]|uniref:ABC transporter ATP-binding protein n=1 Tax=Leptospira interrogans TaxID=173 RepID=UPI0002BAD83B|nr:ABC transporter ATP-binding protein [Leptospira interrogans]EMN62281.1 ABC transporter, ATP-binding protein [Leptospira interrogans serovar Pyrogenes str. R168]MCL8309149.1 ABC transporter ATP-binding protein/permease [Leptospira interrogans]ULG85685.1 ABC transporter ATP-binding protein/permease [Leptospira interrogans]ULG87460.1 ABC transporter ATP-binding protein/permease [Leptospira interrogans]UML77588.1 ABC transporter ATP-binding protein/permease [Leptospira interrogans]